MMTFKATLFGLALLMLAGCAADPAGMARGAGMERRVVQTHPFALTAFVRKSNPSLPVTVYIEGDGRAWLSRREPSLNPTPRDALGLALASADASPNVVYLARPCQFTPSAMNPACNSAYWTNKRFAPEVIASMNEAINQLKVPGQKLHLVGYSGGGGVAALIAASRQDILSLRTIAGNVDSEAFNRYHNVSPMPASLNPISVAPKLAALPQEHFFGGKDEVVPESLGENFLRAMGSSQCATLTRVANASHEENWLEFWRGNVSRLPLCRSH